MRARVELRAFRPSDADEVQRWFSDPAITEGLLEQRESFSADEARRWVKRAMDSSGEDRKWAVTVEGGEKAVGFTALYGLGRQIAPELGVLIGDLALRSRGAGREAIRETARRAFELGAHRVYARILAGNDASARAFGGVGFKREGVMRAHVRRGDVLIDCELWGLLPEDLETRRDSPE
jgi:[ribosomal protein S5]-alanine N-acetyltransferase